jgi:YVTN family beta-propeller protein
VTNFSDSTVSRLDPESGEMQTIAVPGKPVAVAADPRSVVVVTGPGPGNVNVVSLDVDTGAISSTATQPGDQLTTPVVASDGHDLWLADAEQRLAMRAAALVAVDDRGALGRPLPLIPIPKDATNLLKAYETFDDMAASADGVWIAGDTFGRSVWHLDPRTEKLVGTVHLSFVPKGIAAGAGGVWVTSLLGDTVSRIDPASHRITATIPVGRGSDGVAARGGAVWVANVIDGTVSLVDAAGRRVTSTIDVGGPPVGIAAGPDGVWAIVRR